MGVYDYENTGFDEVDQDSLNKFLSKPVPKYVPPVVKPEERGFLPEIGHQIAAGFAVDTPQMAGQAMQYTGNPGDFLYEKGKKLAEAADVRAEDPFYKPTAQEGTTKAAFGQGARMLAPSVVIPAIGAGLATAGIAALPVEIPAAIGAGLGIAATTIPMGMAQGQQTYESGIKSIGLTPEEAAKPENAEKVAPIKKAALFNTGIEAGGEAITAIPALKFLKIGKFAKAGKTVAEVMQGIAKPGLVKEFAKDLGKTYLTEMSTEYGQQSGEAAVEKAYNIRPDANPMQEGVSVLGPTAAMTTMLALAGIPIHGFNARAHGKMLNALADPEVSHDERTAAAEAIAAKLEPVNKQAADTFRANSLISIDQKVPIALDDSSLRDPNERIKTIEAEAEQAKPPPEGMLDGGELRMTQEEMDQITPGEQIAGTREPTTAPETEMIPQGVAAARAGGMLSDALVKTGNYGGPQAIGTPLQQVVAPLQAELAEAKAWAKNEIQKRNTTVMRQREETQNVYNQRILGEYQKSLQQQPAGTPAAASVTQVTPQPVPAIGQEPAAPPVLRSGKVIQMLNPVTGKSEMVPVEEARSTEVQPENKEVMPNGAETTEGQGLLNQNENVGAQGTAPAVSPVVLSMSKQYAAKEQIDTTGWSDQDHAEFAGAYREFQKGKSRSAEPLKKIAVLINERALKEVNNALPEVQQKGGAEQEKVPNVRPENGVVPAGNLAPENQPIGTVANVNTDNGGVEGQGTVKTEEVKANESIEGGKEREGNQSEHKNGNKGGQTAETGGGNRSEQGGEKQTEVARTFEPKSITDNPLPKHSKELLPSKADGGVYYYASAEGLQTYVDTNDDGWMYRVCDPRGIDEGKDVGLPGYKHQFKEGKSFKVYTFTTSLIDAQEILRQKDGEGIVYRIKPADVSPDFVAQVPSSRTARADNSLHIQSPVPAVVKNAEVLYRNGKWTDIAEKTTPEAAPALTKADLSAEAAPSVAKAENAPEPANAAEAIAEPAPKSARQEKFNETRRKHIEGKLKTATDAKEKARLEKVLESLKKDQHPTPRLPDSLTPQLFPTPSTFGKKPQGTGTVDENPMLTEMREREAEKKQGTLDLKAETEPVSAAKIEDFGEKIGGARKDTAERDYTKSGRAKEEETTEPWRKKYVAMEKVDGTGWTIGKKGDSFGISARNSQLFATQEEAEAAIPVFAVAEKHFAQRNQDNTYSIYKKTGERKRLKVVNQDFPSREEAMKYMAIHAVELLNKKTSFGEEILPAPELAQRKGPERRKGPATSEMFMETFAPRGIEFGNWNNQEERQQVMNHAYDGLLDLAETLGLPPRALMLNGDLAIAFGARGQGLVGAKAHYELDYGIINLTKMKGAGSLAHEWFHALDHYLGRLDTKSKSEKEQNKRGDMVYPAPSPGKSFLSHGESYKSKARPELLAAYKNIIETMYKKAEQYVEDTEKADKFVGTAREELRNQLDTLRNDLARDNTSYSKAKGGYRASDKGLKPASAEQLAEFDRLVSILVEGGDLATSFRYNNTEAEKTETKPAGMKRAAFGRLMSGRHSNDTLDAMSAIYKAVRNRSDFAKEGHGPLDRVRSSMSLYAARLKMFEDAKTGAEKTKKVPTSFAMEAKKMDQARAGDYWSEPHEMAARAFAAFVEDKVSEAGGQSDFLVYRAHGGIIIPMIDGFVARPYPEGKEREALNAAFDDFVKALETRETEKGTALYSLREKVPMVNGLEASVLVNPSSKEMEGLYNRSKDKTVRYLAAGDGTVYAWDAMDLTHGDVLEHYGLPDEDYGGAGTLTSLGQLKTLGIFDKGKSDIRFAVDKARGTEYNKEKIAKEGAYAENAGSAAGRTEALRDRQGIAGDVPYQDQGRFTADTGRDKEAVEKLAGTLSKDVGGKVILTAVEAPEAEIVRNITAIFGKKPVFIENHTPNLINFHGVIIDREHIFIDRNTPNPYLVVMGHELLHHVEQDSPLLYAQFVNAMRKLIKDFPAYAEKLNAIREQYGMEKLKPEFLEKELLSDFVGEQFGYTSFYHELAKRNRSLFGRILDYIRNAADRILGRLRKSEGTEKYFRQVGQARQLAADMLVQYGYEQQEKGIKDTQTGKMITRYAAAWHGGPHDFDKFSSAHIGTGEGAQAYGHGLYFAGKRFAEGKSIDFNQAEGVQKEKTTARYALYTNKENSLLPAAKMAQENGESARYIWHTFGWASWKGHWLREIPTNGVSFLKEIKSQPQRLGDVIDFPWLEETYPDVMEKQIYIADDAMLEGIDAGIDRNGNIGIAKRNADAIPFLVHELQHLVQEIENRPAGANHDNSIRSAMEYISNPGEIEARDATERHDMTTQELRNTYPGIIDPIWDEVDKAKTAADENAEITEKASGKSTEKALSKFEGKTNWGQMLDALKKGASIPVTNEDSFERAVLDNKEELLSELKSMGIDAIDVTPVIYKSAISDRPFIMREGAGGSDWQMRTLTDNKRKGDPERIMAKGYGLNIVVSAKWNNGNGIMAADILKKSGMDAGSTAPGRATLYIQKVDDRHKDAYRLWLEDRYNGKVKESNDTVSERYYKKPGDKAITFDNEGNPKPLTIEGKKGEFKSAASRFDSMDGEAKYALREAFSAYIANIDGESIRKNLWPALNPLDWSRLKRFVEEVTPQGVMNGAAHFLRNPVFEAEADENKRAFVDTGIKREETKVNHILKFFGWDGPTSKIPGVMERLKKTYSQWESSDKTTQWGRITDEYGKLAAADRKGVDLLLYRGDVEGKVYKVYDHLGRDFEVVRGDKIRIIYDAKHNANLRGVSEEAFKVYKQVREHIDGPVADAIEQISRQFMNEAGLPQDVIDKHISDYRRRLEQRKGWLPRDHGQGDHQVNIYHVITSMKWDVSNGRMKSEAYLPYFPGHELADKIRETALAQGLKYQQWANGHQVVTSDAEAYGRLTKEIKKIREKLAEKGLEQEERDKLEAALGKKELALNVTQRTPEKQIEHFRKSYNEIFRKANESRMLAINNMQENIRQAKEDKEAATIITRMEDELAKLGDGSTRVKVYMRLKETKHRAGKHLAEIKQNLKGFIPESYIEGERYDVTTKFADQLTEDMYGDMRNDFAMEQAQLKAIEWAMNRGEMSKEQAAEMRHAILQSTAEVLMARGSGAHQIRRAEYLIEGYDKENTVDAYHSYMTAAAGMLSKARYAHDQFENFRYAKPEVKQWAYKYIRDNLRNMGFADSVSGNLRAVASFMYLGFKVSSMVINATQPWVLGVAELGRHTKRSAVFAIGKAQKDIVSGKLTDSEKLLFNSKLFKLQEMETAVHEMSGSMAGTTGKASRIMRTITDKALAPFQEVELLNRKTMILAAYRVFRADGMARDEAMEKAMEVNRAVNFEMSRANLPGFAQGPVGRTVYALQSFMWNNWNWVYNRLTSGEKEDMKALLRYAAAMAIIGGAAALPGWDELDKLYQRLFGTSPNLDLKKWTSAHAKEYGTLGEMVNGFAWHGLASAGGVNISNAIRLQIPIVSPILGGENLPEAAGGVMTGLIQKGTRAVSAASHGDIYKAAENLAPEAISGAMRAGRMATQGATTASGKVIFDEHGKQMKYTPVEAAKRVLGFQPTRVSERGELTNTEKGLKSFWTEEKNDLLTKLRIARPGEDRRDVMRETIRWNTKLRGSQANGLVPVIKRESIERALTPKADKKEMRWKQEQMT